MSQEEKIVMTPKCKTSKSTTFVLERTRVEVNDVRNDGKVHVAGGDHSGIIVNKQITNYTDTVPHQLSLEFKVFLVNASTQKHTLESRQLRFWFKDTLAVSEQARYSQEFFKEMVSPTEFPRDYVGFIMKMMKLMQHRYIEFRKIEVELKQLQETDKPPERPAPRGAILISLSCKETFTEEVSADESHRAGEPIVLTEAKLLEIIESAYPNPVTLKDVANQTGAHKSEIEDHLDALRTKGLIKNIDKYSFTRTVQNETQVRIVKQMPKMVKAKQPTIAIITAQYCEKLAVDAMIENQETFVRYTTVGESNVYTLGNMGYHRVVSTKLPSVGHTREAMIAAGNTTTRLLGTFQKVDYVFLIGVGGGVPHFTDYNKHVKLGDVVVSAPTNTQRFVYLYCDCAEEKPSGGLEFETRGYIPSSLIVQEIAAEIKEEGDEDWAICTQHGLKYLRNQETDFSRPPESSDKLYMTIGEKDVIEVAHPTPPYIDPNQRMMSRVHLGPIASGRNVSRDDHVRQELAAQLGILAYDSEYDTVLESVIGNRRDSFVVIRGIADYKDGTRRRDWQPHSALLAASFARTIVSRMEPPMDD